MNSLRTMDARLVAACLGLLATGVVWGAHLLPFLMALLVGAVVAGAYLGAAKVLGTSTTPGAKVALSADAERWRQRARAAVTRLDEVTLAVPGVDLAHVRDSAHEVLEVLTRTAESTSAIEAAMRMVDVTALRADISAVGRDLHAATGDRRRQLEQSRDSLTGQLDVAERLRDARATEVARLQTSALGLEALVTRLTELNALARTDATAVVGDRVEEATSSLDTLRVALADAQVQTRRLLGDAA